MKKQKFEADIVCPSCGGTGLYIGMAERDGFAVQCYQCKGTGKFHYEYEYVPFVKRKPTKEEVIQVVESNPGIGIGVKSKSRTDLTYESFGGMPYKDWKQDNTFPTKSEMRNFTCPAWWYQSTNYKLKPDWKECIGCGSFSGCDNFPCKDKCWEKFDKEQVKK